MDNSIINVEFLKKKEKIILKDTLVKVLVKINDLALYQHEYIKKTADDLMRPDDLATTSNHIVKTFVKYNEQFKKMKDDAQNEFIGVSWFDNNSFNKTKGSELIDDINDLAKQLENNKVTTDSSSDDNDDNILGEKSNKKKEKKPKTNDKKGSSSDAKKKSSKIKPSSILTDDEEDITDGMSEQDLHMYKLFKNAVSNKSNKLDNNTPIFSGTGPKDDIKSWLFIVENNFELLKVDENKKLNAISPYLRGLALQTLIKFKREYPDSTWYEFKDLLERTFIHPNRERNLRIQLRNLRQKESYDNFVNEFLFILNQIDYMEEDDKILYFTEGLKSKTKFEVLTRKPVSLEDAILIASNYEHSKDEVPSIELNTLRHRTYNMQQNFKRRFPNQNRGNNGTTYTKNESRGRPNYRNRSRSSSRHSKSRKQPLRCYRCKKMGHMSKDCRVKLVNTLNTVVDINAVHGDTSSYGLLTVNGLLDGFKVRALLDPGSMICMVSTHVAYKYKLPVRESDAKIETVVQNSSVVGITDKLLIDINGHSCYMKFYVLDNKYDVILGVNWFQAVGAGVHMNKDGNNYLKFSSDTILLNDETTHMRNNEVGIDEIYISEVLDELDIEEESDWTTDVTMRMKPQVKLAKEELKDFNLLASETQEMFATDLHDLGVCKYGEHKIRTAAEAPIFIPPYRKSEKERDEIKAEIKKMLNAGIIKHSRSAWSSPVILIPKKDGKKRMCIDYRKLNKITVQENWPIPRILDILDRISGSIWFTALDLKSGYWQIKMAKNSIEKTAFSTPDGHYEFLRLPFGLKNAPAEFSRIMYMILGDLDFVEIYLDDITIHSRTFKDHLKHVRIVFDRLKDANLKLNGEKCMWFAKVIKVLGHIVSNNSVSMDPEKIKAIDERAPPTNVKQLQQFLGLCNYYRRFIKDFAKLANPLFALLTKEAKWNWSDECNKSFNDLKTALISYPVLRQPDLRKEFILYTDASGFALGAILAQIDNSGKDYVCAYASRALKGAEKHYGITEKECLAVVWGIKQFRIYLYGTHFKTITDHSALNWLMKINDPSGRLARWSIYLQAYDMEIIHRKGSHHSNVDALSRPAVNTISTLQVEETDSQEKSLDPWDDECLLNYLQKGKHVPGMSKKQLKRVENVAKHYKWEHNKLWFTKKVDDTFLEVPKPGERQDLIDKAHRLGHFQAASTYARLKSEYFWKSMMKDIHTVIKRCLSCQRNQKIIPFNHPAKALEVEGIFDRIGIDLVFGLPVTKEGYKGILVITEYLTKYPYAVPIKSKTAEEIASELLLYVSLFGPPKILLSDQGREFCNSVVNQFLVKIGVDHKVTSAYNPRTNGETERFNQTLAESLRKHSENDPNRWTEWIPFVLMAYRSRVHTTTGYTPFELMFGRKMNNFKDWTQIPNRDEVLCINERTTEIRKLIDETQQDAIKIIAEKQDIQKTNQDKRHRIKTSDLATNTKVFIKNEGLLGKLEPRFSGPYYVIRKSTNGNYEIKDGLNNKVKMTYPLHKLKIIDDENMVTEDIDEVEAILDHRLSKDGNTYLVKFANETEPMWIPESNFNTMEIINNYFNGIKSKKKPKNIKINNPTRKSSRTRKVTFSNNLLTILVLFYLITSTFGFVTHGNFLFCSTHEGLEVVQPEKLCEEHLADRPKTEYARKFNNFFDKKDINLNVLSKLHNKVSGFGWACEKTKLVNTYQETMLFARHSDSYRETVHLTSNDCQYMVMTHKCEGHEMNCVGNSCSFEGEPVPKYSWGSTNTIVNYTCKIYSKYITAHDKAGKLWDTQCKPIDGFCSLNNGAVVIWNDTIIHECPYALVAEVIGNKANNYSMNTILVKDKHWLFQLTDKFVDCGNFIFYKTAEGLYLSRSKPRGIVEYKYDESANQGLNLADEDYENYLSLKTVSTMSSQNCYNFISLMYMFSKTNDNFLKTYDNNNHPLIFYTNNGLTFLAKCIPVVEINVVEKTEFCYKDTPILVPRKNITINAFLSNENIIKISSSTIPCTKDTKYVILPNEQFLIERIGNTAKKISNKFQLSQITLNTFHIDSAIYYHSNEVQQGFDAVGEFVKITEAQETAGKFFVSHSEIINSKIAAANLIERAEENFNILAKQIGSTAIITVVILFIILVILIMMNKISLKTLCFLCRKKKETIRVQRSVSDDYLNLRELSLVTEPRKIHKSKSLQNVRFNKDSDKVILERENTLDSLKSRASVNTQALISRIRELD